VATLPALSAAQTRAAEALLARVWGPTSVRAAKPIWDRSHVVRLHLATDRSVVLKKRADEDTFGVELAALEYLNAMPEPVAPRLLGADAEAGIMLMEDLSPGPSLADSLLTGDRSRVRADLVSYAGALGSMHAWSMGRPRDPRLGTPPWPLAVAWGRDAFLGAALSLGLAAAGAGTEIDQLSLMLTETGYHGLVHGDACPDNVRFADGRCRDLRFRALRLGRGRPRRVLPAGAVPELLVLRPPARLGGCARHVGLPRPSAGGGHRPGTFVGCGHDSCLPATLAAAPAVADATRPSVP
jgi:Ser/Thr protein kinase RdoA (MazF antagonist)